jgi:HK97 family phage prohead protease
VSAPSINAPEIRSLPLAVAELRVERRDGDRPMIQGYAARYNVWSQDLGGFIERILPGAFDDGLQQGADVRFLVNHEVSLLLGRNKSGTLRLTSDDKGLFFVVDPPDSDLARHYIQAVERGDLTGCSFRFYVDQEAWNFSADPVQRDLLKVRIDDVSLATFPAYLDTSAAVRSLEAHRRSQPRRDPWLDRAHVRLRLAEAD